VLLLLFRSEGRKCQLVEENEHSWGWNYGINQDSPSPTLHPPTAMVEIWFVIKLMDRHFCYDQPKNWFMSLPQAINQHFLKQTTFISGREKRPRMSEWPRDNTYTLFTMKN
jgi:hypothetical protein